MKDNFVNRLYIRVKLRVIGNGIQKRTFVGASLVTMLLHTAEFFVSVAGGGDFSDKVSNSRKNYN